MSRYLHAAALLLAGGILCLAAGAASAADAPKVGVVSHINVLSNNVEDVSSPEAWKKTYIKDGMTDEQKALAIWTTVVKYRHQDSPPNEFFSADNVHDPLKTIHVYGYGMCCCAAANIEGLARYIGMPARGRIITQHSVPEVWYDGAWHLLDASLMCYFRNKEGKIASVDEMKQSIMEWRKLHPEIKNDADLKKYSKDEGWKNGPTVLATNLYYDKNGINSAGWHGWWSNVVEYNWKQQGDNKIVVPPDTNGTYNVFDYGAIMGYQLNVQLRPGETITRNWSNKGMHVNESGKVGCIKDRKALGLQEQMGDKAPGRVGNGTSVYDVPLADGAFRTGALTTDNLSSKSEGAACAVAVKDASKPGVLVIRMPSSYVYLAGEVSLAPVVGANGSVVVSFSDNQGLDWKEVGKYDKSADGPQKIDLKSLVIRRYDYRLKFEFNGAGSGLNSLKIANDIQHSQAPLPVLLQGDNKITFSAGAQEGTVTYEGCMEPEKAPGKQVSYLDYHPVVEGLDKSKLLGNGSAVFNLETPGDMTRVRMGCHFRCRDLNGRDYYDVELSFDNGETWQKMGKLDKAQPARSDYLVFDKVPAGVKKAQLRFTGKQNNTTCMFDLRIDADYKEPNGGFAPVKVTLVWTEGGAEKTDSHVAKKPDETWSIKCGANTVSKSFIVELAQ